jgi:uncharacterized protein (TIGR02246 family)
VCRAGFLSYPRGSMAREEAGSEPRERAVSAEDRARAQRPEDLSRFFVERANAGDLDGLMALYEPEAVMAVPGGQLAEGADAIRAALARFLAGKPTLSGQYQPALQFGDDLALTSTKTGGDATAEVARRQPDGTWLWVIDKPRVLG